MNSNAIVDCFNQAKFKQTKPIIEQLSLGNDDSIIESVIEAIYIGVDIQTQKPDLVLYALRFLKDCVETLNERFLEEVDTLLLPALQEIALFKLDETIEDNRGKLLFGENPTDEERKFGLSVLRLVLECIQIWSSWFKDLKKSDGSPYGFQQLYQVMRLKGVVFPALVYFKQDLVNTIQKRVNDKFIKPSLAQQKTPNPTPSGDDPKPILNEYKMLIMKLSEILNPESANTQVNLEITHLERRLESLLQRLEAITQNLNGDESQVEYVFNTTDEGLSIQENLQKYQEGQLSYQLLKQMYGPQMVPSPSPEGPLSKLNKSLNKSLQANLQQEQEQQRQSQFQTQQKQSNIPPQKQYSSTVAAPRQNQEIPPLSQKSSSQIRSSNNIQDQQSNQDNQQKIQQMKEQYESQISNQNSQIQNLKNQLSQARDKQNEQDMQIEQLKENLLKSKDLEKYYQKVITGYEEEVREFRLQRDSKQNFPNNEMNNEIEELRHKYQQIDEQRGFLEVAKDQLDREIILLRTKNDKFNKDLQNLNLENQQLRNQVETLRFQIQNQENDQKKVQAQTQDQRSDQSNQMIIFQNQIKELNSQIILAQQQKNHLELQKEQSDKEILALKTQIEKSNKESTEIQLENKSLNTKIQSLKQEQSNLIQDHQQKVEKLQNNISQLQVDLQQLQKEFSNEKDSRIRAEGYVRQLEDENQELSKLQDSVQKQGDQSQTLQKMCQDQREEIKELQNQIVNLKQEKSHLEITIQQTQQKQSSSNQQLIQFQDEIQTLKQRLSLSKINEQQLNDKTQSILSQNTEQREQIQKLKQIIDQYQEDQIKLEKTLNDLQMQQYRQNQMQISDNQLVQQHKVLQQKHEQLLKDHSQVQKVHEEASSQIYLLNERVQVLNQQLSEKERQHEYEKQMQFELMNDKFVSADTQREHFQSRCEQLEQELNGLKRHYEGAISNLKLEKIQLQKEAQGHREEMIKAKLSAKQKIFDRSAVQSQNVQLDVLNASSMQSSRLKEVWFKHEGLDDLQQIINISMQIDKIQYLQFPQTFKDVKKIDHMIASLIYPHAPHEYYSKYQKDYSKYKGTIIQFDYTIQPQDSRFKLSCLSRYGLLQQNQHFDIFVASYNEENAEYKLILLPKCPIILTDLRFSSQLLFKQTNVSILTQYDQRNPLVINLSVGSYMGGQLLTCQASIQKDNTAYGFKFVIPHIALKDVQYLTTDTLSADWKQSTQPQHKTKLFDSEMDALTFASINQNFHCLSSEERQSEYKVGISDCKIGASLYWKRFDLKVMVRIVFKPSRKIFIQAKSYQSLSQVQLKNLSSLLTDMYLCLSI